MFEKSIIILLTNILFYAKTVNYEYVSDDIHSSMRNRPINVWLWAFWVLEGRLKSKPRIDHALTTLLHSLVGLGIYLGFGANAVSFIAALLFSFNPVNNQGSVWISGRGYVLSALGMVWALALPMEMGGLMMLGATYSNAGFFMPLALLGSSHPYLFIFAPLVWWYHSKGFSYNVKKKMDMELLPEDKDIHPRKLILAIKTFGIYLSHSLVPIKTTFYHSYLESIAGSKRENAYSLCKFFWFGLMSLVLMVLYICTHKWDMVCFGMLWCCVGIAPFCNLYRCQQEIGERYAYVPSAGIMLVLSSFIYSNPYIVAGFIMMYATKMWFFMEGYKNDAWMVENSRINSDKAWFSWHIMAMKKWESKSYQEAVFMWNIAKSLSPQEFKILFNLATAFGMCGQKKQSLEFLAEAEKNIPRGQEKACNMLIWNFKRGQTTLLT